MCVYVLEGSYNFPACATIHLSFLIVYLFTCHRVAGTSFVVRAVSSLSCVCRVLQRVSWIVATLYEWTDRSGSTSHLRSKSRFWTWSRSTAPVSKGGRMASCEGLTVTISIVCLCLVSFQTPSQFLLRRCLGMRLAWCVTVLNLDCPPTLQSGLGTRLVMFWTTGFSPSPTTASWSATIAATQCMIARCFQSWLCRSWHAAMSCNGHGG